MSLNEAILISQHRWRFLPQFKQYRVVLFTLVFI